MGNTMEAVSKPDTLKAHPFKEWVRINFLSPHIQSLPKDKKILDLACGWGFAFKINPNMHGVEYDQKCVDHLQGQGLNVTRGNILQELPFEKESYDIVFSHDVLEHFTFEESEQIFKVVRPILKPGGLFINVVPNELGYEFGIEIDVGHKHYVIPEDVKSWAAKNDYKYLGFYDSPLPKVFHHFYKHNKRVITCQKPEVQN